jgi:hypothetical protein
MANTNAIVEKLKDVGLRHGEKAGVAIASTLFFVCIGLAAKKETISTTPEKIKAATTASSSNLDRHEDREKIIQNLETKGIKDSDFAKVVNEQVKTSLVPGDYKATREWVSLEPGAGLIRDTPILIAASDLYAYPGRGGFNVYELDADGHKIVDDGKDEPKNEQTRRRRRRRAAAGGGMMGGGMMGGMQPKRKKTRSAADIEQEARADEARRKNLLDRKLSPAGGQDDAAEAKTKEGTPEKQERYKEITKGHRWVAITGVLDHAQLVANYRAALKNPTLAHPHYSQVDLQRKTLLADGSWSNWEAVSSDENLKILDNLPEEEEDELTPETVRPKELVDPLPFLTSGLWEKVHVATLVPNEKKKVAQSDLGGGMMGGGMMGGGMMRGGMMGGSGGAGNADMMNRAGGSMMRGEGRGGMMGGMGSGMMRGMGGGMMGGGMGQTESAGNYWKTDEKKVMIRAFDFTVAPDTSYRYRVRIVVFNPNYKREDVSPLAKEDTKKRVLRGPWSEATDEVHVLPDVMPYAIGTDPSSPKADMKVTFHVIRFRPSDGVTVTRRFSAGPGEVIGEPVTADIPVSDGSKKKSSTVDFNSHQIVVDINANKKTGGWQPLPSGFVGAPIERPALTLLLRKDGSVALHSEADDVMNEVRKDIENNYRQEIKDSGKERRNSFGSGMMGMGGMMGGMGGMGGMRGGGMGSGMR